MRWSRAKGFTLIEIIIVMSIVVIVFTITFPLYLDYNKRNELRRGAQQVRNEIEFTVLQASNGVVPIFPSPAPTSNQSYWLIWIPSLNGSNNRQLIRAACAVENVNNNSCTINNGVGRTVINLNSGVRVRHVDTPSMYADVPLVLYYSPVYARLTIRTSNGLETSLTSLKIEVRYDQLRVTDKVTLTINSNGKITEESTI
jgi:prepilin-type N-terminal cleavage/methylation domain-containing protein